MERLLTQARVLVLYLGQLLLPLPAQFSLYHDDIAISTGLFSPPATAACLLFWVLVLLSMPSGWRRRAPWAFALDEMEAHLRFRVRQDPKFISR